MDFDPRWPDDERNRDQGRELSQGSRGGVSDPRERASLDPRDVFMKDLDLPRGPERERVRVRDHHVTLRGSESRTLSTVGAFRVVPAGDLRDSHGKALDPRDGDLKHLKREGLVQTIPVRGQDRALVVLTEKGRDVLETSRRSDALRRELEDRDKPDVREPRQEFHAGMNRPREPCRHCAPLCCRSCSHDASRSRRYACVSCWGESSTFHGQRCLTRSSCQLAVNSDGWGARKRAAGAQGRRRADGIY